MQRKALLLHVVGSNTFDIFMNFADKGTTHNQAKAALTNYFKPKVNKEYERAVFRRLRQEPGEKIDAYHTRLRNAFASCSFEDLDGEIKSHVIQTTTDSKLRKHGLRDDALTLKDIIEAGRNNELTLAQNAEMEKDLHGAVQDVKNIQHKQRRSKPQAKARRRLATVRTATPMLVVPNRVQRLAGGVMCVNDKITFPNSIPKMETLVNMVSERPNVSMRLMTMTMYSWLMTLCV